MDDIYENIDEHNSGKRCKIMIVFDDTFAHMISSKTTYFIYSRNVYQSKKTKHFNCFYYTIIL